MAPRLGGVRINPVSRFQGAWASKLSASSAKRWEAVFAECDLDSDGYVDRRETLVLLSRLGVRIPSDSSLKALIAKHDIDENEKLDFSEFCDLVRDVESAALTPEWLSDTSAGATRQWFDERRNVVLWREIFDSLDTLPRNGFLEGGELRRAFRRTGVPFADESLSRQLAKYDTNSDGRLSFEEYKRMSTDLISSAVQYERAVGRSASHLRPLEEAQRIAEAANEQSEVNNAALSEAAEALAAKAGRGGSEADTSLREIERRIGKAFVGTSTFDEAEGVLQTQDDLYRRFKAKYDQTCTVRSSRSSGRNSSHAACEPRRLRRSHMLSAYSPCGMLTHPAE